jgi:hypothetical protein
MAVGKISAVAMSRPFQTLYPTVPTTVMTAYRTAKMMAKIFVDRRMMRF